MADEITARASTYIAPNPSEVGASKNHFSFTNSDCIAVYLGQEPGTAIAVAAITDLLNSNMMEHAIAVGRSALIRQNRDRYMFCGWGDREADCIMRELRADWPAMAPHMNAEFILSLWFDDDLERWVEEVQQKTRARRRAAFDAETLRSGNRVTVERARRFVASELEISMRDTIRRTLGFKADQVLALAA